MKVAIAWYGAEGQASYEYYVAKGDDVTIVTPKVSPDFPLPAGAPSITGDDAFEHLHGFDLVVRSAGTRPDTLKTDGKIWSATNEFFARCPAPIIGVTGTKGKGTTSSLIVSILRAAGKTVHLVGNIGVPPLKVLQQITPDDIVVFELSSFQLWDIERSPHVAVVLMIEPDHLDVHKDYEEYVEAKANIVRHQTKDDYVVYCLSEPSLGIAQSSNAKHICYGDPAEGGAYVSHADNMFYAAMYSGSEPICPVSALQLVGDHNKANACAAITASLLYTKDKHSIENGLKAFTGLPHRLQFVAEKNNIRYYDDSIATTAGSAIAALRSFPEDVQKVLILGGINKGADYMSIIVAAKKQNAHIVAIGQSGLEIASLCKAAGVRYRYTSGSMDEIVTIATSMLGGEGVVILSPASASFDMFKNYSDRGNQFINAVKTL